MIKAIKLKAIHPKTFNGDTIFVIDYNGEPYVPMRPIIENMALSWPAQLQKLNAEVVR